MLLLKKYFIIIATVLALSIVYFWSWYRLVHMLKEQSTVPYTEATQQYAVYTNVGCVLPKVNPFSEFALKHNVDRPKIICKGYDWVQCNMSQCGVRQNILNSLRDIVCYYKDITYVHDQKYALSEAIRRCDDEQYVLNRSDYLKVSCTGYEKNGLGLLASRWYGYIAGIRPVTLPPSPQLPSLPSQAINDLHSINILIVAFDSTPRSGFIRKMPKSYKVLIEEMGAVVLEGYNVVGDGTKEALFPILSGKTDAQHNHISKGWNTKDVLIDPDTFIFQTAKKYGYHTAYYEDMPWIGTFQYRYNGFREMPADHYLRPFLMAECKNISKWYFGPHNKYYCVGDKPTFLLLLDLTRQFMKVRGKRFCFTFISDICHDDFNLISTAEDDLVDFLRHVKRSGYLEDTMVIVMGDHGPRFGPLRETSEGRLDERLPLMSIILPEQLNWERPDALRSLQANAHVLTTPFDIHTTLLDAMGLSQHASDYVVKNATLKRGLSLLKPIPRNRTCEDAAVSPRWCVCLNKKYHSVTPRDPMYLRCVDAVVQFINKFTEEKRSLCAKRALSFVKHVSRLVPDVSSTYTDTNSSHIVHYELLIVLTPGHASFDASLQFDREKNHFYISEKDISRVSTYGLESSCVSATHPHLAKYCYCGFEHGKDSLFNWLTI